MAVNDIHNQAEYQGQNPFLLTRTQPGDTRLTMKGAIRSKEKCPRCLGKFGGTPLHCPTCMTVPKKYCVDIYEKVRLRIYSDKQGNILDSYERAYRVLTTIRYEIDQGIFDPTKYRKADLTDFLFETRIDKWYQRKEKDVEKGNRAPSYTKCLRTYIKHYYKPFFKGRDVREIRTYDIDKFYEQLPSKKSLKYIKNIINALENFFNTLVRHEYITRKPSFPIITVDNTAPKCIDLDSQLRVLQNIPEDDKPIFQFLMFQGTRPAEARALKVKDFTFKEDEEMVIVSRTYSERQLRERVKGKRVAPRKLNPLLVPMLKELCKNKHPEAFVFINPRTGKPYSENATRRIWKKIRKELGLEAALYQSSRHSLATIMINDGVPLTTIQQILSHADFRTTLKYAFADIQTQKVAFNKHAELVQLHLPKAPCKTAEEK